MYMFDPERGKRRRTHLRDQTMHAVRSTRKALERAAYDARNHTRGLIAKVSSKLCCEEVSDEMLVERVRSKMGHVISEPKNVEVMADAGSVVLRGTVSEDEAKRLVQSVSHVRGVTAVESQLKLNSSAIGAA